MENQRHTVALNMYESVSTARCIFTSVFTEIFLKHSQGKLRGKYSFDPYGRGLIVTSQPVRSEQHDEVQDKLDESLDWGGARAD